MLTYDYEGNGSNGSKLEHTKIYLARATGAPHPETGKLRESKDDEAMPYKAIRNGSLFSMWPQFESTYGYRLPQYMEFKEF